MPDIEHWKKRIIEKFIERSQHSSYYITDLKPILDSFGRIEYNANLAWEALLHDGLLVTDTINGQEAIHLNPHKELEIMKYFNKDPAEEVMAGLQPPASDFEGLEKRINVITENAWPNQGTYYLCTLIGNPASWVFLFRSKPNKPTTRTNLGSLTDKDSRITKMWKIVRDLGQGEREFYKKQAEDLDQRTFGNNRQPATAAFNIFVYLGWIREFRRRGKQVFYLLAKADLHDAFVNGQAYVCHECSKIYSNRYCDSCEKPI
ncbi:MAG: hypothetical protein OXL96_00180 [Candidatus Poribacteria bacterium]|nr:hypothetical protein [Candidatus Poribacteria bacterium]